MFDEETNLMKRPNYSQDRIIPNIDEKIDCTHVRLIWAKLGHVPQCC